MRPDPDFAAEAAGPLGPDDEARASAGSDPDGADPPAAAEEAGGGAPRASGAKPPDGETEDGVAESVVETFQAEVAEARRLADENWDRYLRAEADLDNLRRRGAQRQREALDELRRGLLEQFLEVADNLERALSHGGSESDELVTGLEGTYRELQRTLSKQGVEPVDAMGAPFDPDLHDAVAVVPMPGLDEAQVISVERRGYTIDGDLLRPARVVVGKPAAEDPRDS